MTLASTLRQKLNEAPGDDKRHDLMVADETAGWALYLTAERRDAWTTVIWEMTLRRATSGGDVAAWAQRIPQESSGLLEALCVVEVDVPNNRALLRSDRPTEQAGKIGYYELILHGTTSALARRFEGNHEAYARTQVPFALTNEVLAKWVGDLTAE